MASIRFISTSTILQAQTPKEPTLRIDLTPWDLQLLLVGPIQKGLLFLKPKSSPSSEEDKKQDTTLILHLKTSLSRTLDFFSPLAGRLAIVEHDNSTTSFFIDCNNNGALFVHAVADGVTIADIVQSVYVPSFVNSFFALNGTINYEGISKPLLAVQITELVDGIFIGCTINHVIVDGTSFWHFFNSWSEISRGLVNISSPPVLKRWFPHGFDRPLCIPRLTRKQISDKIIKALPLKERVFHFSKEKIAELKAKANTEIGTNKISSLQAMLTHLWKSVVRCRFLDPDQETHYRLLIGVRPRLHPALTQQYFGNAVQAGTVTLKARELLGDGLGKTAWKMNKMVGWHTEEKFRDFLMSWIEQPKLLTMDNMTTNALVTSSSPRFNVYGNDFGWGRPIAVRSGPGNKHDGKITVFPGVEAGNVDIELCLTPETLQAMGNDSEFMAAVSI